jgi:hypothetical protein
VPFVAMYDAAAHSETAAVMVSRDARRARKP